MRMLRWNAGQVRHGAAELAYLLTDTVAAGASVGFLAPLDRARATAWWRERADGVARGELAVWAALDDNGRADGGGQGEHTTTGSVLGTIGLAFPALPNGRHRAEVVKLMVHPTARGQGLARRLLTTAEQAAAATGITLLHLDTETGSPAERLYDTAGWTRAGAIPGYATNTVGTPRATTLYYKRLEPFEPLETLDPLTG
ncbi:GNAT family N-acetyltransferase [Streptomyces sp. NPDC059575]|uniref:GNAT family N-acetyltransferase n=1 Tax=Streptomyces sp. NPDC059575 TaxID=3346872 RepID=UPI0036AC6FDB